MLTEQEKELILQICRRAGTGLVREFVDSQLALEFKSELATVAELATQQVNSSIVTQVSSEVDKIALFMSLFRGRNDVYAKRWQNASGKSGYSPSLQTNWCSKCKTSAFKCKCNQKAYLPLDESVIKQHLQGKATIGIYPMVEGECCYFLAFDFDEADWRKDVAVFRKACIELGLDIAIERSRSGNGCHAWIFFDEKTPARIARRLGSKLLAQAMQNRHEISFKSYDRMFPNQDTMPKGGFGNLIALPLQRAPRQHGNSVFVDENFLPFTDQWAFLSGIKKLSLDQVTELTQMVRDEDIESEPWDMVRHVKLTRADCPDKINIILTNGIFIRKQGLSNKLLHKLKRLASFNNPAFFKNQAMRLSTHDKPRIISCADEDEEYLCLPRGLMWQLKDLLRFTKFEVEDRQNAGNTLDVEFNGTLHDEQEIALSSMVKGENGVLSASTAFGKTVVAVGLIAKRKVNTLILVHRTQLATQWRERLQQFLATPTIETGSVKSMIGQYGGGKKKTTGQIDIAVMQSLRVDKDFTKDYGMVIVDECHHISAFTFEQVLKNVNAKYVYGLTATPKRQDGHEPIVTMQCGPIVYDSDRTNQGDFARFVIPRFTKYSCNDDVNIANIHTELATNNFRNELIIKDVLSEFNKGRTPIILCQRKDHVQLLTQSLSPFCENVIVLMGGGNAKERKVELDRLKAIDSKFIIVATGKYIGEGFDEARLDTLFLVGPISWKGTLEQYVGRLHRNCVGKSEVIVYDYADIHSRVLEKMYQNRLKGYARLGYKSRTVAGGESNIIFNSDNFETTLFNDINSSIESIVIASPYLYERSVNKFIDMLADSLNVEIIVYTKQDEKNGDRMKHIISLLETASIKVHILPKLHQQFIIIDKSVIWYGELNPLSYQNEDDIAMRIPSREIATELLARL